MNTGENIKHARINAGLTQKQLANAIGISEIAIRKFEANDRKPKLETLLKIASILNVPVDSLSKEAYSLYLEQHRARFIGAIDQTNPPHFTVPADDVPPINAEYTIQVNIDRNSPLNIALKKLDDGKPLTERERQLIKEYVNSDTFRKIWAELPAHFKKLADSIRKSYSLLNAEGKKEAVKQIELADRQIELLTEIPKYRKPDNEE